MQINKKFKNKSQKRFEKTKLAFYKIDSMKFVYLYLIMILIALPVMAEPDASSIDVSLPSTAERYITGLEEQEFDQKVDRRIVEKETTVTLEKNDINEIKANAESPKKNDNDGQDGFWTKLFQDQTYTNLLLLMVIAAIFVFYRLQSRRSRR